MDVWSVPLLEARALFRDERAILLALLEELSPQHWSADSKAEGWTVRDIALHLLDGDLGRLSRGRDGELTGARVPDEGVAISGPERLTRPLESVRGIIA